MADSYARFVAMPAMFAIVLVDGLVALLAMAFQSGLFLVTTVVGLAGALVALAGLVVASRGLTLVGILGQTGGVTWLMLLEETSSGYVFLLLGVGVAALLALAAVVMPAGDADKPAAAMPVASAPAAWARTAALVAMSAVAVVALGLLVAASRGGIGLGAPAGVSGLVGLAGAAVCMYALLRRSESLTASVAVVQGVLSTLLLLLVGVESRLGIAHLFMIVAAALTAWAALGPGLKTRRS